MLLLLYGKLNHNFQNLPVEIRITFAGFFFLFLRDACCETQKTSEKNEKIALHAKDLY